MINMSWFFDRSSRHFVFLRRVLKTWMKRESFTLLRHLSSFLHRTAFSRVVYFNRDNCSKQMVHSIVRLPRLKILKLTAYWLKNFIFKRRCVTEEGARVSTAEVSLCIHSVNTISVCWCSCWSFVLFFLFQVPLIYCASTWRAGETKNDASLKLKTLLQFFAIFLDNSYMPVSSFVFVCRPFYLFILFDF
jgi:hypothetical protein